jgi:8-oxo-dGTP pyrophosphatase MutT (NUDIX family)
MSDNIVYDGKLIRVTTRITPKGINLETVHRPHGTRIIIHDLVENKILLSDEVRLDIGQDFRLPGGKVCDTNFEWDKIKDNPKLNELIIQAAIREVREEVGFEISNPKIFSVSTSGAPTINFDLYYLIATSFVNINQQNLQEDEVITASWYSIKDVIDMCLTGKIREGRSVAVLLQYLHSIGQI